MLDHTQADTAQGAILPKGEYSSMALYMDMHNLPGVTPRAAAEAHMRDRQTQARRNGVDYRSYWVDERAGKFFCLVEAPNAEAAAAVHRESHGLVADQVFKVRERT